MSDGLWPGHPRPLRGESFSSWFCRTASANGLRPRELFRVVSDGAVISDLDRPPDPAVARRLASKTGISASEIRKLTFARWAGALFDCVDGQSKLSWLPPTALDRGKRRFGQQFCRECLAEDAIPHLRLQWRLAFLTTCAKHGCLLLDRCPTCGDPLGILRIDARLGSELTSCTACGSAFLPSQSHLPITDTLSVQDTLLRVISDGWMTLGSYGPVYSFAYFEILAFVVRMLSSGSHAPALRFWIAEHDRAMAPLTEQIQGRPEFSALSVITRGGIVSMAFWLCDNWPVRFVAAARDLSLRGRDIFHQDGRLYPFALVDTVACHLMGDLKRDTGAQIESARRVLIARGDVPTLNNLSDALGGRRSAAARFADRSAKGDPWGVGRYWKIDGVSPQVKAAVRRAAHEDGQQVGPWLDTFLKRKLHLIN